MNDKEFLCTRETYYTGSLVRRLNVGCAAPSAERKTDLVHLNLIEVQAARVAANRQIVSSLSVLCLYPLLLVLSVKLQLFRAPFVSTLIWSIVTIAALACAGCAGSSCASKQDLESIRNEQPLVLCDS